MTWIIGDIHGCVRELSELIEKIPSEDPLLFLGDYVDRGPSSREVVDLLLVHRSRSVFLLGNHESMLLAHFFEPDSPEGKSWLMEPNGGRTTLNSYNLNGFSRFNELPEDHQAFYKSLKLYHEGEDFIAVHAGVRVEENTDMARQNPVDLLWIRRLWINHESEWKGKRIYYGHTPSQYLGRGAVPIMGENSVGLDTGCVYGGSLTAYHHPDGKIIQIASKGYGLNP